MEAILIWLYILQIQECKKILSSEISQIKSFKKFIESFKRKAEINLKELNNDNTSFLNINGNLENLLVKNYLQDSILYLFENFEKNGEIEKFKDQNNRDVLILLVFLSFCDRIDLELYFANDEIILCEFLEEIFFKDSLEILIKKYFSFRNNKF